MLRPLALAIGLRYTRAKRRNHFISFISFSSIFGIALGITVVLTVLSVMNGFQIEVRNRILSMTAHITITNLDGTLRDWQGLRHKLRGFPHVKGMAPYVTGEAMLINGQEVSGAVVRGVLPKQEPKVSKVGSDMVEGSLKDLKNGRYGILLGQGLARSLHLLTGDKVTVVTPHATTTPAGILPKLRRFTVVGIFSVGIAQYDQHVAIVHMDDAERIMQLRNGVTGLRLRLDNLYRARAVARQLTRELGPRYWVSDWTQQHANFFRAVKMEKTIMFIIMILIVAVAAFNIVSTLVMVVTDKQADIAILRTMGVTPRKVMGIFMIQGTMIGGIGTLIGVLCGVTLALNLEGIVEWIEHVLGTHFLSPDVYYISELPSHLEGGDVALVASVAFLLTVLATLYPAWRAARTQPAEALRYE